MACYVTKSHLPEYSSCGKPGMPSFTATNSVLIHKHCPLTRIGFTPIIPYLATEYNAINTCMRNFQDVFSQNGLEYGPLWCSEGVYRIAKELQLLNPEGFGNIFLGQVDFILKRYWLHASVNFWKKVELKMCSRRMKFFGPGVVKTVMNGIMFVVNVEWH